MGNYSSILYIVRHNPDLKLVEEYIERGYDVDYREHYTALILSCEKGYVDIVRVLLEAGADPNLSAGCRVTPLYHASRYGHIKIVELLLNAGADPNLATFGSRATPLLTPLIRASRDGQFKIAELLLNAGADPDLTLIGGITPLITASRYGQFKIVELLLTYYDVNINAIDDHNITPLMYACFNKDVKIIKLLLFHGAEKSATKYFTREYTASSKMETFGEVHTHECFDD